MVSLYQAYQRPASSQISSSSTVGESIATFGNMTPKYPEYHDYQMRLRSFVGWPLSFVQQCPEDLSACGFFYIGSADRVTCFYCGVRLRDWSGELNAREEHKRYAPDCDFINNSSETDSFEKEDSKSDCNTHSKCQLSNGFDRVTIDGTQDNFCPLLTAPCNSTCHTDEASSTCDFKTSEDNLSGIISPWDSTHHTNVAPSACSHQMFEDDFSLITSPCDSTSHTDVASSACDFKTSPWDSTHHTNVASSACNYQTSEYGSSQITSPCDSTRHTNVVPSEEHCAKNSKPVNERKDINEETTLPDLYSACISRKTEEREDFSSPLLSISKLQLYPSNHEKADKKNDKSEKNKLLRNENRRLKNCHKCSEKPLSVLFMPCGHLITCQACAKEVRICFSCGKSVLATVKTFMI